MGSPKKYPLHTLSPERPPMYPDRLTALASAAHNAGARDELHNLGGVHADAHHATLTLDHYAPEKLPASSWAAILALHARTAG